MKVVLYEEKDIGETLYLISAFDDKTCYIVTMQFPTVQSTIDEYNQWKRQVVKNAICLNDYFPPQELVHSDIKRFVALGKLVNEICAEKNVEVKDVLRPFFGGVIGFDFRELMKKLYAGVGDFWDYRRMIKDYYGELIQATQEREKDE